MTWRADLYEPMRAVLICDPRGHHWASPNQADTLVCEFGWRIVPSSKGYAVCVPPHAQETAA